MWREQQTGSANDQAALQVLYQQWLFAHALTFQNLITIMVHDV